MSLASLNLWHSYSFEARPRSVGWGIYTHMKRVADEPGGGDRVNRRSGNTLLNRFTVVSLVATIVVGGLFGAVASWVVEGYALERQAHAAAVYVSEFVAPRLVPQDFLSSNQSGRVQFEFALRDLVGKAGIARVTVWDAHGLVLYSSDPAINGRTFPPTPLLRRALAGQIQWQLVRPSQAATARERRMEVLVPVVVPGTARPVGVYHVLSDLKTLEPALRRLKWSIWASVVVGVGVLYGTLITLVIRASRDLERQQGELRRAHVGTVESLANAVDARDLATGNHSSRVADYAAAIAQALGLRKAEVNAARVAGYLHDIGKIGIRDVILTKPGPLTDEEWTAMREHPAAGYEILRPVPIAVNIKLAVRHSHEWWNGNGYPDRLVGKKIPLLARVIAVADAYEALTTDRPYRRALSLREAVEEIQRCSGTQFDPEVVDALLQVLHLPKAVPGDRIRALPGRTSPGQS